MPACAEYFTNSISTNTKVHPTEPIPFRAFSRLFVANFRCSNPCPSASIRAFTLCPCRARPLREIRAICVSPSLLCALRVGFFLCGLLSIGCLETPRQLPHIIAPHNPISRLWTLDLGPWTQQHNFRAQ